MCRQLLCVTVLMFLAALLSPAPLQAGGPFVAKAAADYKDKVVGNGECVAYVQKAAGAPLTKNWVQGSKVKDGNVTPGTAIATLSAKGYANKATGNHAAIFDGYAADGSGFYVWDQWRGQPVHRRLIRYKGGSGSPSNDGEQFYVIMTK